ncbi:type II toxin-antitoxin system HipA family toxin [Nitratidesulfovibrio termitidis]|uniref:type II toxin-antitoxin system HipA family toxin n=1 Tax=Nitratidesulfovibrio termitidis TaxID=42252 RepID=UPI0003FFE24F|nr:HipA domain-containing protein [Nitratidesulfovibrio termitidis]
MRTRTAYVHMHLQGTFVPAGLLTVVEDGRRSSCAFQYGHRYLERADAVPVDPVQLPLAGARSLRFDGPVGGDLFGGIRDASPDAWGRHVLDRTVDRRGENAGLQLSELDYLLRAGPGRIGALGFSLHLDESPFALSTRQAATLPGAELDLEALLMAADAVDNEEDLEPRYRRFFIRGSSLGGARPKAAVELDGRHWIAKFDRAREAWPTCRIEHGCMRLARLCGIDVPDTRILRVLGGRDILLVERFDRRPGEHGTERIPFVSGATMLGYTQSQAEQGGSYPGLAAAMRRHCRADTLQQDIARLYLRMAFNALVNNTDDHLRNHGFLYEQKNSQYGRSNGQYGHSNGQYRHSNGWTLSPAYDLVPQPIMGNYDAEVRTLSLTIGEQGRLATERHLVESGGPFALAKDEARHLVAGLKDIIASKWEQVFREAGVPSRSFSELRACLAPGLSTRQDGAAQ